MPLSLKETQILSEFSSFLYGFLPGSGFASAAQAVGLSSHWPGGSKQPAIETLLSRTYDFQKGMFCNLMIELVRRSIAYGNKQGSPLTKENILRFNEFIQGLGFKIPELWDPEFLRLLPSLAKEQREVTVEEPSTIQLAALKTSFGVIQKLEVHARGYEFERFLKALFDYYKLDPRASFRIVGEQIDGSFDFENETYLMEAKWEDKLTAEADLLVLHGKTIGKAQWARGLFVSYTGFSQDAIEAFSKGKPTNIVGLTGQDLHFILEGKMSLTNALHAKVRGAAETGRFYIPVYEFL